MAQRRTTVLLADDHIMMLRWLRDVLLLDFEVVGIATDGSSVINEAKTLRPDVVVLDMYMPVMDGLAICDQLMKETPAPRIVFLTVNEDGTSAQDAIRRGAVGYVVKKDAVEELADCLRAVTGGRVYVSRSALKSKS